MTHLSFCEFLWPLISGFLPIAIGTPDKCEDIFALSFTMLKLLREAGSAVLDQQQLLDEASYLLLRYETYEVCERQLSEITPFAVLTIDRTLRNQRQSTSLPAVWCALSIRSFATVMRPQRFACHCQSEAFMQKLFSWSRQRLTTPTVIWLVPSSGNIFSPPGSKLRRQHCRVSFSTHTRERCSLK